MMKSLFAGQPAVPTRTRQAGPQAPALQLAEVVRAEQTTAGFREAARTTNPADRAFVLQGVVIANLRIADRIARRYFSRGISSDDLIQVARLGLVHAVNRFDPSAGSDFLSFATPTIAGELKRHFRDQGWAVRPTRRVQELRPRISVAVAELAQSRGRTPTRAELADCLGVDAVAVAEAQAADGCFFATSLDRPIAGDTDVTLADRLGRDDPSLDWVALTSTLAPVLRHLSDRDRLVLRLRFADDLTQSEIGKVLGVTQMQVSRILGRILSSAKRELAG